MLGRGGGRDEKEQWKFREGYKESKMMDCGSWSLEEFQGAALGYNLRAEGSNSRMGSPDLNSK
jgi:hypothetical protein